MVLKSGQLWFVWVLLAAALSGWLGTELFVKPEKPNFLIGETSHAHHQIEMQCTVCHLEPFDGINVLQEACTGCHSEELRIAQDSHPRSKFTDPRNADTLAKLDARYCVTCHREHNEDITQAMAVTLPQDFCFHCHADIATDRPSHEGMAFETCASAGCHNYHDNRALYEDFLVENSTGPWLNREGRQPDRDIVAYMAQLGALLPEAAMPVSLPASLTASTNAQTEGIKQQWASSAHANSNVGCNLCHGESEAWQPHPERAICADCHDQEAVSFLQGRHGMRLAQGLSPMTPRMSVEAHGALAFDAAAMDTPLDCSSCHDPHTVDVRKAAVTSCLGCHSDEHSLAFRSSPHGELWEQHERGEREATSAVSCATCHMTRQLAEHAGVERVLVTHNQNDTLRPNEKMIRPVCMSCHSLAFSIDALADPRLIENNFSGAPGRHMDSVDMALERTQ